MTCSRGHHMMPCFALWNWIRVRDEWIPQPSSRVKPWPLVMKVRWATVPWSHRSPSCLHRPQAVMLSSHCDDQRQRRCPICLRNPFSSRTFPRFLGRADWAAGNSNDLGKAFKASAPHEAHLLLALSVDGALHLLERKADSGQHHIALGGRYISLLHT